MPRFRMSMFHCSPPCQTSESGYLLATMAVLLLVVIALVGTFAFIATRDSRFKGNYATGERLADLAVMAHYYAQDQHYGASGTNLDAIADLYDGVHLVPPDGFSFGPVANTHFTMEIVGRDASPVNAATPVALKAASAYLHLRIRGVGRAPSDDVALESGANHGKMQRIGFYKTGIVTGDLCDGATTAVRWGPEDSSCLNDSQIAVMFLDVQKGDIIVPAWETALAKTNDRAMMRYPQPERPDLNVMNADLHMRLSTDTTGPRHNIENAASATMDDVTIHTTAVAGSKFGTMLVRGNSPTDFQGGTEMDNGLRVYDQNGGATPMTVAGAVNLTGGDVNISQNLLKSGTATLAVSSTNTVNVDTLGSSTVDMMIKPSTNPTFTAGVEKMLPAIGQLVLNSATSRLTVANNIDGSLVPLMASGTNMAVYVANLNMSGTTQTVQATTLQVGSISQTGNSSNNFLAIDRLNTNGCYTTGGACPTSFTGTGGGGF
jgi:hypothetical protein